MRIFSTICCREPSKKKWFAPGSLLCSTAPSLKFISYPAPKPLKGWANPECRPSHQLWRTPSSPRQACACDGCPLTCDCSRSRKRGEPPAEAKKSANCEEKWPSTGEVNGWKHGFLTRSELVTSLTSRKIAARIRGGTMPWKNLADCPATSPLFLLSCVGNFYPMNLNAAAHEHSDN